LEAYRRYKPQIDQLASRESHQYFIGERMYVPKGAKYVSRDFGDNVSDNGTEAGVFFGKAFKRMLEAICPSREVEFKEQGGRFPGGIFHDHDDVARYLHQMKDGHGAKRGTLVELTQEGREAVRDVYVAINLLLREATQDGRERGQNLLQQLAAGEVAVGDFERHLDDIARNRRESDQIATHKMKQMERDD